MPTIYREISDFVFRGLVKYSTDGKSVSMSVVQMKNPSLGQLLTVL